MGSASSSSPGNIAAAAPPLSEEAKPHPYQQFNKGPRGAYEARQIVPGHDGVPSHAPGGLYVRVDMPGVPEGGVKVVQKPDSRTVTFTGKAPAPWANVDSSDRVYAGYVVLDRDLDEVAFESFVRDGCFRVFFPGCDGSLHFLSPSNNNPSVGVGGGDDDDDSPVECRELGGGYNSKIKCIITYVEHAPEGESGIRFSGGKPDDINPSILRGPKSCYEHKAVDIRGRPVVYVRLDVPGINWQMVCINEMADRSMLMSADGVDCGCAFDMGTRHYMGSVVAKCSCCRYSVVMHDLTDGVLRFMARRVPHNPRLIPPTVLHHYEAPSKPKSSRLELEAPGIIR